MWALGQSDKIRAPRKPKPYTTQSADEPVWQSQTESTAAAYVYNATSALSSLIAAKCENVHFYHSAIQNVCPHQQSEVQYFPFAEIRQPIDIEPYHINIANLTPAQQFTSVSLFSNLWKGLRSATIAASIIATCYLRHIIQNLQLKPWCKV